MKNCIFCKIISRQLPAKIIFENKDFIAFWDIRPQAPVHLLFLPKKHIRSLNHLTQKDKEWLGKMFFVLQRVVKKAKLKKGYKLAVNVEREGGQLIDHLHFHILGGWKRKSNMQKQKFP